MTDSETKPCAGLVQRRNSLQKQREAWVVSDRVKTPSPTPPVVSAFVAKKSRPSETVSFSLPPGGFKNQPEPKTKSLNSQIDELFSQYYPAVNTDLEEQLCTAQVVEAVVDLILHQTLQLAQHKNTEDPMSLETTPGKSRKRKRPENLGRLFCMM